MGSRIKLEALGYWFNECAPSTYPRPHRLVGPWPPVVRTTVIAYLRTGAELEKYRAVSFCRFACGDNDMGCRDLTDGRFVWPEGLAHYIEHHDVLLPDHFVEHALQGAPCEVSKRGNVLVDDASWIAWGAARGAAIDLGDWTRLDWGDQRKALDELHARISREHPLFQQQVEVLLGHRASRELLVVLSDGRLVRVRVTDGAYTFVAGWDHWTPRTMPLPQG